LVVNKIVNDFKNLNAMKTSRCLKFFTFLFCCAFIFSCEKELNLEDCISCPPTPIPITPTGGTEPPIPVDRYILGVTTGTKDAVDLWNGTYLEVPCRDEPEDKDLDDLVPSEPKKLPTKTDSTSPFPIKSERPCFFTVNSVDAYIRFIIGYRELTLSKIAQGQDVRFNQGLLDGFNERILEYALNFGTPSP
jgi:hypothetical protein